MKIAILGTKGVPNNYGGFEQFAEYLSVRLVHRGHDVTVYNPHFHPFKGDTFEGVKIVRMYSPENVMGGAANFIYDHLCLGDALKRNFDIIYEAGYHSVAFSYVYYGVRKMKTPVILTNMDGLEWKRSKWSSITRKLIVKLEKIAVKNSPYLVSDNEGIRQYYLNDFGRDSFFIPYGAEQVKNFDQSLLAKYNVTPQNFNLIIARLEPENNIETILDGYTSSTQPLVIVGNHKTRYGQFLAQKFSDRKFQFVGAIYEKPHLDALRHFSLAYFHGHSVGGTNPSLLEAMACNCFIVAHDNPFNSSVLDGNALLFRTSTDVEHLMTNIISSRQRSFNTFNENNIRAITERYNWDIIVDHHVEIFKKLLDDNKR